MKRVMICLCLFALVSSPAFAFLYEVKILSDKEIKDLAKEEIIAVYTEALIERKASETFHSRAGFAPKEYRKFKELLGLIVNLRLEMQKRDMDVPPIDEWLR